jgi:hypothetical protein
MHNKQNFQKLYKLYLNRFFLCLIIYSLMFTKSIAIVDDDRDLLNIYSEALKTNGYIFSSFTDPILAYEAINKNQINIH